MPLLNYTTKVPAARTVGEIQAILATAGVTAIMTEYAAGAPVGISFKILTAYGPISYSLPCRTTNVKKTLEKQLNVPKKRATRPRVVTEEEAARIGWRILKDWIEAQMALVETNMAAMDQVFLPYAITTNGDTVYGRYVSAGMTGLALTE